VTPSTGVAVEIEANVRLLIDIIAAADARCGSLPTLESGDRLGVVAAFGGVPLTSCVRAAYADLCERLQRDHGYCREGASALLGQVASVHVGNMIERVQFMLG